MTVQEIAEIIGGEIFGDKHIDIKRANSLDSAINGEIAFLDKAQLNTDTNASCLIVPEDFSSEIEPTIIKIKNPKLAFAKIAGILHPPKKREIVVHQTAIISPSAKLGKNLFVGAFVCVGNDSEIGDGTQIRAGAKIGDNVKIGTNCVIHPNVFIEDDSEIGDNVILHAGVCIGADGFGYVRDGANGYVKFPQIGKVVIENDVEIGANSCVDRGALGETRIGEGTKIDNLVQVAHNVKIGKRVVIAAQTGISGSSVIEDDCVIGGQVGIADHATLKQGAIVGAQAGVLPGKIVREGVWWGTPVQPLEEYKRQNAHVKSLERLKAEVKELKSKVENSESKVRSQES